MRRLVVGLALATLVSPALSAPPEPPGFHGEPYRSPVPETLAGATVLDFAGMQDWRARGAVLIDVMPQVRKPADLPEGTLWR